MCRIAKVYLTLKKEYNSGPIPEDTLSCDL